MVEYKTLHVNEISLDLFRHFQRHQIVAKCWRKIDGIWCIKDIAFTEEWGKENYALLVSELKETLSSGGMVSGAYFLKQLKGFVSVEADLFGRNKEYLDLSNIIAKTWAKTHGAKKLYISAHSAVESQAFYRAMGCVEAQEYDLAHMTKEPCDCQLECAI